MKSKNEIGCYNRRRDNFKRREHHERDSFIGFEKRFHYERVEKDNFDS